MQNSDVRLATDAAKATVADLGLPVDDAVVLRDSDKLMLRLLPCDVVARIAHAGRECAELECVLARRLADLASPVAVLDPRFEPRMYTRDGFVITFWTYYESLPPPIPEPDEYADALYRLHAGMRSVDIPTPHFMDRVEGALSILASREQSPELPGDERELLASTLRTASQAIADRGAPEQVLHGEPHPGNVLRTTDGLRFIDLETCCRGPVEYDIAHGIDLEGLRPDLALEAVAERYPGADPELVRQCYVLMLAMITTWRWNLGDQLPDRERLAKRWTAELRRTLESRGGSMA